MPKSLVDLLWRAHPAAPQAGARGPRARQSVSEIVECAMTVADEEGLGSVTIRTLATKLGMSTMSVYTHVNSRDDLLVLMADATYGAMELPDLGEAGWRTRVRRVAEANRSLFLAHPWLLQIRDPRSAMGPGTIAKYDHELKAFDGTGLRDLDRDAAVAFVVDFVRSNVIEEIPAPEEFTQTWRDSASRLAQYVAGDFPLAQRVGQVAGAQMGAPYSPEYAWRFGLERVIVGLAPLIE